MENSLGINKLQQVIKNLFAKNLVFQKQVIKIVKKIYLSNLFSLRWLKNLKFLKFLIVYIFSDYLFKVLLIGNSGVGKSSLLLRFAVSINK